MDTGSPGSTTAPTTDRAALIERNRLALEARWKRQFALPTIEEAARRDPASTDASELVQVRAASSDGWLRVHSARDPFGEANRWIDEGLAAQSQASGALPSTVCLVGAGQGFAIDAIEARSPKTRVLVLEPEPGLVPFLLARRDWTHLIARGRLLVLWGPAFEGAAEAWRVLDGEDSPLVLSHPVLVRERKDAALEAAKVIGRATIDWKANREARGRFAGRYLFNTFRNLPRFETAGDVRALFGSCRGLPAVVAGAGPSLNRNLDDLRALGSPRDHAVLIACDTALHPCLAAEVEPHFALAVDPAVANVRHLSDLPPCPQTWFVAEPSVDPEAFAPFEDRTLLFRVADHHPWPWLQAQGKDRGLLRVWGSVLTASVDFALQLGCDPIILIGADLAYTNGQPYCRNTAYEAVWAHGLSLGMTIEQVWEPWMKEPGNVAPDIHGVPARTTSHLIAFRDWLRDLSVRETSRRFVNATGAGVLDGGRFTQGTIGDLLGGKGRRRRVHVPLPPPSEAPATIAATPDTATWERWLASDPAALLSWTIPSDDPEAAPLDVATLMDAAIEERQFRLVSAQEQPAKASVQAEMLRMTALLDNADVIDAGFTNTLRVLLESGRCGAWPLYDRLAFVTRVCETYVRAGTRLAREIYPGVLDVFRSTLVPALHPGFATALANHVRSLCWVAGDDAAELAAWGGEILDPLTRHARAWAGNLRLPERRALGEPPYRVAYLCARRDFGAADGAARGLWSLCRGHAARASTRFEYFYYAWSGIADDHRRELASLGVTVRVQESAARPCSAFTRLRTLIASDHIDVLITDTNMAEPVGLFGLRAAPIQMLLGPAAWCWGPDTFDYAFLNAFNDADALGLAASAAAARYEYLDWGFDARFVQVAADAAIVADVRARCGAVRHVFGFSGRLTKPSPDYFHALTDILGCVPDAALYLTDVGDAASVREALSACGAAMDRVIVDAAASGGEGAVHAIDTVLEPFPFSGGLTCLQAQHAGRPVVHRAPVAAGAARLVDQRRDPALRASTVDEYVALACQLATNADAYTARAREATQIAARSNGEAMAAAIEGAIERLVAQMSVLTPGTGPPHVPGVAHGP